MQLPQAVSRVSPRLQPSTTEQSGECVIKAKEEYGTARPVEIARPSHLFIMVQVEAGTLAQPPHLFLEAVGADRIV